MKKIIINVDDLGFSHAVNEAVVILAQKKRIQATSFMSLGEVDRAQIDELKRCNIDIGLHFDLTGLAGIGNLKQILFKAYLGKLSLTQIHYAVEKQLDLFEDKIDEIPHFIDGHQHVHQFPYIRQILLKILAERYSHRIPIRNTETFQPELKAKIIYMLGGSALKKTLRQNDWAHNASFGGIYNFNTDLNALKNMWENWLAQVPDNSVIMCHPAKADTHWTDDIYAARCIEYEWLLSDEFLELWNKYNCQAQSWKNIGK